MGKFPDGIYPQVDHPSIHVWRPFYVRFPTCVLHIYNVYVYISSLEGKAGAEAKGKEIKTHPETKIEGT